VAFLVGAACADQFITSTTFLATPKGKRFCIPVGQLPQAEYQLSIQFATEEQSSISVIWNLEDLITYNSPVAAPIHTVDLHTIHGDDLNGFDSMLFAQTGVVTGVVSSDSKLLKVIAAFVPKTNSVVNALEQSESVCRSFLADPVRPQLIYFSKLLRGLCGVNQEWCNQGLQDMVEILRSMETIPRSLSQSRLMERQLWRL